MGRLALGTFAVLAIIFIVPVVLYGALSKPLGMSTPEGVSPSRFLLSTLVSKVGTAALFAVLYYLCRGTAGGNAFLYSALWFFMLVMGEIGQAIGPNYSWKYALVGILSEAIYVPVSVLALKGILGRNV